MSPAMDHLSTLLAPAVCCILLSPCTKAVDFEKSIQPILKLHCYTCHSEDAEEGIVRLDRLDPDLVNGKDAGFWHEALNQINESRMPPAGETQLTKQELYILTDWLEGELEKASAAHLVKTWENFPNHRLLIWCKIIVKNSIQIVGTKERFPKIKKGKWSLYDLL